MDIHSKVKTFGFDLKKITNHALNEIGSYNAAVRYVDDVKGEANEVFINNNTEKLFIIIQKCKQIMQILNKRFSQGKYPDKTIDLEVEKMADQTSSEVELGLAGVIGRLEYTREERIIAVLLENGYIEVDLANKRPYKWLKKILQIADLYKKYFKDDYTLKSFSEKFRTKDGNPVNYDSLKTNAQVDLPGNIQREIDKVI